MGMITASGLRADFNNFNNTYGQIYRIRYLSASGGSATYDDNLVLTQNGSDYWGSGVLHSLESKQGSDDAVLLQQGKLLTNDSKLYVNGLVNVSGIIRIGFGGSPTPTREYSVADAGTRYYDINGEIVYKKVYIRALTGSTLQGE